VMFDDFCSWAIGEHLSMGHDQDDTMDLEARTTDRGLSSKTSLGRTRRKSENVKKMSRDVPTELIKNKETATKQSDNPAHSPRKTRDRPLFSVLSRSMKADSTTDLNRSSRALSKTQIVKASARR
jgi:hypothetical protein